MEIYSIFVETFKESIDMHTLLLHIINDVYHGKQDMPP